MTELFKYQKLYGINTEGINAGKGAPWRRNANYTYGLCKIVAITAELAGGCIQSLLDWAPGSIIAIQGYSYFMFNMYIKLLKTPYEGVVGIHMSFMMSGTIMAQCISFSLHSSFELM